MFKRSALAAGLASLGMLGTITPPAMAANTGSLIFTVDMQTPPLAALGLGNPYSGGFAITDTVLCTGENVGKTPVAGPCTFTGAGSIGADPAGIGAYCGHGGGWISGRVHLHDAVGILPSVWVRFTAHFVMTASLAIVATGTATIEQTGQTGPITFGGVAVPPGTGTAANPHSGSCFNQTARTFRVTGNAEYTAV